ncbi:uncharacterized protein HGUI_02182 [Hanseniaspora guilliermondii]|uniref:Uncharacterized protein n=1 Tax=Hanseniaspora guilliermondii TaxID=56406 RepID=A0A1L0FK69_9ASCO|nr:uncharacterized protein HGUI_02182 [Hanseniaspora guilliermondii]
MLSRVISKRSLYTTPEFTTTVLPPVYKTQEQFDLVRKSQHNHLVNQLNAKVCQTKLEPLTPYQIMEKIRDDKSKASLFNTCSHLVNNHLFITNIIPSDNVVEENVVQQRLMGHFEVETMGEVINKMVTAMNDKIIGQGFCFIIEDSNGDIVPIFSNNAGTVISDNLDLKYMDVDLNGGLLGVNEYLKLYDRMHNIKRSLNRKEKDKRNRVFGSKEGKIEGSYNRILACINLWDYAFIKDYGIGYKAREQYFINCMENLNWEVVNKRYNF